MGAWASGRSGESGWVVKKRTAVVAYARQLRPDRGEAAPPHQACVELHKRRGRTSSHTTAQTYIRVQISYNTFATSRPPPKTPQAALSREQAQGAGAGATARPLLRKHVAAPRRHQQERLLQWRRGISPGLLQQQAASILGSHDRTHRKADTCAIARQRPMSFRVAFGCVVWALCAMRCMPRSAVSRPTMELRAPRPQ